MSLQNLSHAELWQQLRKIRAQYNVLSRKEQDSQKGVEMEAEMQAIRDRIKELDESIGKS